MASPHTPRNHARRSHKRLRSAVADDYGTRVESEESLSAVVEAPVEGQASAGADAAPPVPEADLPVTIIAQRSGWGLPDLGEIWRYRELLFFLTWRDVKVRYKQTVLGAAWAVLQPLATMVVFSLFLGQMAGLS